MLIADLTVCLTSFRRLGSTRYLALGDLRGGHTTQSVNYGYMEASIFICLSTARPCVSTARLWREERPATALLQPRAWGYRSRHRFLHSVLALPLPLPLAATFATQVPAPQQAQAQAQVEEPAWLSGAVSMPRTP